MSPWWKKLTAGRGEKPASPPLGPLTPYEVVCSCGQLHRGLRQAQRQLFMCRCGTPVFVLPQSYWPALPPVGQASSPATAVEDARPTGGSPPRPPGEARRIWLMPFVAGCVTLAILLPVIGWLYFQMRVPSQQAGLAGADRVAAAREAIRQNDITGAQKELDAAASLAQAHSHQFSTDQLTEIKHLRAQVNLLADLIDRPLEDLLEEERTMSAADWGAHWKKHYDGRGVAFDAQLWLKRDPIPSVRIDYAVGTAASPARIDLTDLVELRGRLGTDKGQRLLFGVRLAHLRPEEPDGSRVIRFQNGSFVLLDEPSLRSSFWRRFADGEKNPWLDEQAAQVAQTHGLPRRLSFQIVRSGYVEQWFYDGNDLPRFQFRRGGKVLSKDSSIPGPANR